LFISKLADWKRACLTFYFCSDEDNLDELDERNDENDFHALIPEEEWDRVFGKQVQQEINKLLKDQQGLASYLVKELIHLQDIFTTEDISLWDASSIINANENWQEYTGSDQLLIPLPVDEYEYWEKILDGDEDDEEGVDTEEEGE